MSNKLTTEEFISKAKKVHGDVYDYDLVTFTIKSDKITIVCKDHGNFEQRVSHHLNGNGCPTCHFDAKRKGAEDFIVQAKELYGTKYNYDKVVYKNNHTQVEILCKDHGVFYQSPKKHLLGLGCKGCLQERSNSRRKESFIAKAKDAHGDKYDYSLVEYKGINNKVYISCPDHGVFQQTPALHLRTCGCFYCGKKSASDANKKNAGIKFLKEVEVLYQGKYDYSLVDYKGKSEKVSIICPVHGVFQQTPIQHMKGVGCNTCNIYKGLTPTEYFIYRSKLIHGTKYDYSLVDYTHSNDQVKIICPEHGAFYQEASSHSSKGAGCTACGKKMSKCEDAVVEYIKSLGFKPQQSNRSIIKPLELDIVIPEKKIAIEYNGLRWHSEKFGKDKAYHKNKTDLCKAQGYRLIHIWEDDFTKDPQKELDFISYVLGVSSQDKVYARKTTISEIDNKVGREFLDKYHIQGSGSGSTYYGTYYKENLVAVTSFLIKKDTVELTRHASDRQILGGLGKVTKHASKLLKEDIVSFCDLSRFDGKSYLSCGYKVDKTIPPDYKYLVGSERQHKFVWRKKSIAKKLPDIFDPDLTEKQMMELADIPRIWDCGKLRLTYKYKGVP